MRGNTFIGMFATSLVVIAGSAGAATSGEELTVLNTEIAVLDAKVKRDELKLKDAKLAADLDKARGGSPAGDYKVSWVEGLGKKMFAQLTTDSGGLIEVRVGDRLQGGLKVVSIAPNEVVVENSNKVRRILTVAAPPSPYAPQMMGYGGQPMPMAAPSMSMPR